MITLVNPYTFRGHDTYLPQWEICEHLGIACLMSALRRGGFECSVVNAYLRELAAEEAVDLVLENSPELIGLSILNENLTWAIEFARRVKSLAPDIPIVVGGYFPTIIGARLLAQVPDFDFAVRGDGEEPLVGLAINLHRGGGSLAEISGLIYRLPDGAIAENPLLPLQMDLDEYPFAARDDASLAIDILARSGASPALRLVTSRGCSYRCSFCNIVEFTAAVDSGRRRVRARSPGRICDEIQLLTDRFGVDLFVISDDVFLDRSSRSRARVECFLDELDRRSMRIKFACQFRLDGFREDLFERMLAHGLVAVAFGVETIEQQSIDFFLKDTTNLVLLSALERLSKYQGSVNISLYMLLYHPFTTMEEIAANYEFLSELGYFTVSPDQAIMRKMLTTRLQVFRGGRLERQLADADLLVDYNPAVVEPAVLRFKHLDRRVPEFLAAVDADLSSKAQSVKTVFEQRLDEYLHRPPPGAQLCDLQKRASRLLAITS